MPRLVHVITKQPEGTRFFQTEQLVYLQSQGFDVAVVMDPGPELAQLSCETGIETVGVSMRREISPLRDLVSFVRMLVVLRKLRPDILTAGTPKAALLSLVAGWLLRVPVRVYVLRGLRLETSRGFKRRLLAAAERITAACAHRVICVSESLQEVFLAERLGREETTVVLGHGSSAGVDVERFRLTPVREAAAMALCCELGIPSDSPVIGFVGRLTPDKGAPELLDAFDGLARENPSLRLLLVGDWESGSPLSDRDRRRIVEHPGIIKSGFVGDPERYYPLMDVVAFPSHREGFPRVPLEAAAAALPVVGYRVTGTVDAIDDGVTGTLVAKADVSALTAALRSYLNDAQLRRRHGQAALARVECDFRCEDVWRAYYEEYLRLLGERAERVPANTLVQSDVLTRSVSEE